MSELTNYNNGLITHSSALYAAGVLGQDAFAAMREEVEKTIGASPVLTKMGLGEEFGQVFSARTVDPAGSRQSLTQNMVATHSTFTAKPKGRTPTLG